ncbi:hypothetical protein WAF17_06410 [Bernardetia sp. ABR2-2B]|uniref:hypothetical protein n=1 Tax=Bernardetia sp. ABR2-2B TaxID=3127472 RepID=UPI0030D5B79A
MMMYEFIADIKKTHFYKVFCTENFDYTEKIFANENWQFAFFKLDMFLFNDENRSFMSKFCNFFSNEKASLYVTAGEPIEEVVDGYGYRTIKFSSQLDFLELPYEVPNPDGQNLAVNWLGDFLWTEKGTWGIYHDRYNFVFILGYDTKIKQRVEDTLLNHPNRIFVEELYEIIDELYPKRSKDEILREKQKKKYFNDIAKSNSWFRKDS